MLMFKYLKSFFNKNSKFFLNNYGNHIRDFTFIEDVNLILYKLLKKNIPSGNTLFNICSSNPIKITKILKLIDKNFINKPKIYKREFQKADVFKTHGNNYKIKKFLKKINFTNIEKAVYETTFWYKKNFKLFN